LKGIIINAKRQRRFLAKLRPKIHKLCVVRTYENMNELLITTNEVGKVLGKISGTPFEPLKDKKEEKIIGGEMFTNRQLHVLNRTLIFFPTN
jgi:hypothetical protein